MLTELLDLEQRTNAILTSKPMQFLELMTLGRKEDRPNGDAVKQFRYYREAQQLYDNPLVQHRVGATLDRIPLPHKLLRVAPYIQFPTETERSEPEGGVAQAALSPIEEKTPAKKTITQQAPSRTYGLPAFLLAAGLAIASVMAWKYQQSYESASQRARDTQSALESVREERDRKIADYEKEHREKEAAQVELEQSEHPPSNASTITLVTSPYYTEDKGTSFMVDLTFAQASNPNIHASFLHHPARWSLRHSLSDDEKIEYADVGNYLYMTKEGVVPSCHKNQNKVDIIDKDCDGSPDFIRTACFEISREPPTESLFQTADRLWAEYQERLGINRAIQEGRFPNLVCSEKSRRIDRCVYALCDGEYNCSNKAQLRCDEKTLETDLCINSLCRNSPNYDACQKRVLHQCGE